MQSFLFTSEISAPNVIGKKLADAVNELSSCRLGVRLLELVEDNTHPEGTVLDQLPMPTQKIRYNQHVFLTLSTKQKTHDVPDFWGKMVLDARSVAEQKGFELVDIPVAHSYPEQLIIGQNHPAGETIADKKIKVYLSKGVSQQAIMPDLVGAKLKELETFFKSYDIRAEIYHSNNHLFDHDCNQCHVVTQHPAKGAIVDLSKTLHIQLQLA